ncbi:MAG: leucine-rich repeat domain-containing protein [Bacteroidales bacterium]|nr:leucine-rich repeat domain-containing protein [Bacteroidales bacterium]
MKTKLFTLLFALLSATGVFAKVHQIGVLYYDVYYSDGNYCAMVAGYIRDLPTTIVIPKFVTYENQSYRVVSIGSNAFRYCTGLTSVTIGNSVTSIGDYAFYNCTALLTMEVKAVLPPMIQSNTFNNVSTTVMLTVPCESQNYYKAAQYWNQFTNWQEAVLSFSAVTEDVTKGKVSVTQKPTCDDPTAVIKAVPAGGYRFKEWSDGNTENPRTVWVDEEMDLVAYFAAEGDGVENIAVIEGVSIAGNRLCIAGHEEENMNLYSATGAQLYAGQVRDITLPNAGVYLVQIGNAVQKLIVP